MAEFVVNNKVYSTKVFCFMANYGKELRIGADIRRKGKSRESNRVCREDEN